MTTSKDVKNDLNDKNTKTLSSKDPNKKKLMKKFKKMKEKAKKPKKYNNYISNLEPNKKKTARDLLIKTGQIRESLLKESVEGDAAKYFWALTQLGYKPDFNHVVTILDTSKKIGVDGSYMIALVAAESSFIPDSTHYQAGSNDYGLFQLNNLWHDQHRGNVTDHIKAGIKHFKWCLTTEKGNMQRAFSRYNTGGGDNPAGRQYYSYVMSKKRPIDSKARQYKAPTARGSIVSRGRQSASRGSISSRRS